MGLLATALGQFWWNKGATEVDAGTLAVMNNLHMPVGLLLNLLIREPARRPRPAWAGAVIVASLWVNRLGRREACMRISGQGVLLSLAASVLFVTPLGYVHLLEPLDSLQVVAHRVVWSIPMVFLLVVATRQWPTLRAAWCRLFAEPWLLACFPLTAAMMLLQWGIFIWAPLAGKTLELSLGYFLLPLAMVLVGAGVLRRAPDAAAGYRRVPRAGRGAPRVLADPRVLLGLPGHRAGLSPYFMLRRRMGVDAPSGFVFEMLFLLPLALARAVLAGRREPGLPRAPRLWLLLPMLGLISAGLRRDDGFQPAAADGAVPDSQLRRTGAAVPGGGTVPRRGVPSRAAMDLRADLAGGAVDQLGQRAPAEETGAAGHLSEPQAPGISACGCFRPGRGVVGRMRLPAR